MNHQPHPDKEKLSLVCAVITVSDTKSPETDASGKLIMQLLELAGHHISAYQIIKDEPSQILELLSNLSSQEAIDVVIFNGGTGIAPRDTTIDAISAVLEKTLPGFGELFRFLSYQEIGTRAIASRAIAGLYRQKIIFSLPGSTNAVRLATEKLIIPEIVHLVKQATKA